MTQDLQARFETGALIEETAIADLKDAGLSQNRALVLLGASKSARHY